MGVDMELLESGKKKLRIQNDPDIHVDGARGPKASLDRVDNSDAFVNVWTNWKGHGVLVFQNFLVRSKKSKTGEKES